jgi:hypothetical protein
MSSPRKFNRQATSLYHYRDYIYGAHSNALYISNLVFVCNCINQPPDVAGAAALLLQADPSVTGIQAAQNLVNMATQDTIRGKIRIGSPNRLLYVGEIGNNKNTNSVAAFTPISLNSVVPLGHARIVMQVVFDNTPQETRT